MKIDSIEKLISDLDSCDFSFKEIKNIVNKLYLDKNSLQKYLNWERKCYTRNLVVKKENYELIVLCWGANCKTYIHNHPNQDCFFYVVDGTIDETMYIPDDLAQPRVNLKRGRSKSFSTDSYAYINDKMGLHRIKNMTDEKAISLHMYFPPRDTCNIYCPDTGKVETVSSNYFSRDGEVVNSK